MKIRAGFVSNSSSSSFVLVGKKISKNAMSMEEVMRLSGMIGDAELPEDEDEREDLLSDLRWDSKNGMVLKTHDEDGAPDGFYLLGFEKVSNEYGFDYDEVDIDWAELKSLPESFGPTKIFVGTKMT